MSTDVERWVLANHETSARFIYQDFVQRMLEVGRGHQVFTWEGLPNETRDAFVAAVANHQQWLNEQLVHHLAEHLRTGQRIERNKWSTTTGTAS